MYDSRLLDALAARPDFAHEVRTLARGLLASGAVTQVRHVAPLTRYGPECSGAALRLRMLDRFVDLSRVDNDLARTWVALAAEVDNALA